MTNQSRGRIVVGKKKEKISSNSAKIQEKKHQSTPAKQSTEE
jgi:hypothetical protein